MILMACCRAGIQLWSIHAHGSMSHATMTIVLLELIWETQTYLETWSHRLVF
ncbi:hypothetical protein BHE74_00056170 [Ensete ventricosum]|uniref:Uncharacterized protein n=1 Tax=Ensete ventricosum TaxID=4639 RepID=A0A444EJR8_ENSVE|nr:hypothetical protein B296_00023835 [Ensete ventricosum]RWW10671.1 hypothetical protein GW17_00025776 [Ensete ventricosum]RWW38583.1 hypothetical protein BHE74_00056170 [Ensete ventricosum]RZS03891.1 hypothetical protein BHM03_00034127 [Ensete ventricosum]